MEGPGGEQVDAEEDEEGSNFCMDKQIIQMCANRAVIDRNSVYGSNSI